MDSLEERAHVHDHEQSTRQAKRRVKQLMLNIPVQLI